MDSLGVIAACATPAFQPVCAGAIEGSASNKEEQNPITFISMASVSEQELQGKLYLTCRMEGGADLPERASRVWISHGIRPRVPPRLATSLNVMAVNGPL